MIEIQMIGTWQGDALLKQVEKCTDVVKKQVRRSLYLSGKDLMVETRRLINEKPKHGKTYFVRLTKINSMGESKTRVKKHVASAPYEAPAVLTGALRKSLDFHVCGYQQMYFYSRGVKYAKYLEYKDMLRQKGRGSNHILPRPFMSTAFKNLRTKIIYNLQRALLATIKEVTKK
jgi:hypothetical protein